MTPPTRRFWAASPSAAARADEVATQGGGRKVAGKLGGGPVPVEVTGELGSLEREYARGTQPIDRLYGFDRLLSLDVATTAALDSGDERLELGHVRLGIEDWRTR